MRKVFAYILAAVVLTAAGCAPAPSAGSSAASASAAQDNPAQENAASLFSERTQAAQTEEPAVSYDFALPEVAVVSGEVPASFSDTDLLKYVPASDMTLYFENPNSTSGMEEETQYIFVPGLDGELAGYVSRLDGMDLPGALTQDTQNHCLAYNGAPWLIVPGLELSDEDHQFLTVPSFFTVTTPMGTFEDCLCCLKSTVFSADRTVISADFFAEGVGKVLTTTDKDSPGVFSVYQILTGGEDGADQYVPLG